MSSPHSAQGGCPLAMALRCRSRMVVLRRGVDRVCTVDHPPASLGHPPWLVICPRAAVLARSARARGVDRMIGPGTVTARTVAGRDSRTRRAHVEPARVIFPRPRAVELRRLAARL